jgi:hypothetical protein
MDLTRPPASLRFELRRREASTLADSVQGQFGGGAVLGKTGRRTTHARSPVFVAENPALVYLQTRPLAAVPTAPALFTSARQSKMLGPGFILSAVCFFLCNMDIVDVGDIPIIFIGDAPAQ